MTAKHKLGIIIALYVVSFFGGCSRWEFGFIILYETYPYIALALYIPLLLVTLRMHAVPKALKYAGISMLIYVQGQGVLGGILTDGTGAAFQGAVFITGLLLLILSFVYAKFTAAK